MSLLRFVARRVAWGVVFVLIVASIAFLLALAAPGDALTDTSFDDSSQERALRRAELGLDRPVIEQYGRFLAGLVRFDLGQSSLYHRPVAGLVRERALNTSLLAIVALTVATLMGIPLGRFSGSHRGWLASATRLGSLFVLSVPPLVGSLVLVFLAAITGWVPVGGMTSANLTGGAWLLDLLRHLPVPVLALALPLAASLERVQSRAMAEASAKPFVRASLARGLARAAALRTHAWPASLAPVLGVYGVIVGSLFSGSFVVEYVSAWPGLGRLLFDALGARDVWLVAGCGAAGAVCLAAATTLADVVHALVDPRVLRDAES